MAQTTDVQQALSRYRGDAEYFEAQRSNLLTHYAGQWVAIYDRAVVAMAESLDGVVAELTRKGLQPGEVFVEYLSAEDDVLILDSLDTSLG